MYTKTYKINNFLRLVEEINAAKVDFARDQRIRTEAKTVFINEQDRDELGNVGQVDIAKLTKLTIASDGSVDPGQFKLSTEALEE